MAYRFWLLLALFAGWVWLVWRWQSRRGERPAPHFPIGTLLILLVIGGFEGYWQYNEYQINKALAPMLKEVPDAKIRCQRFSEAYFFASQRKGEARWDAKGKMDPTAMVTWETCQDLFAWMRANKDNPTEDQVIAVHVAAHEAAHLTGLKNEAETECVAVQWDSTFAKRLGATAEEADALAYRYWTSVYPRMPEDYRSFNCGPGAKWDIDPAALEMWPNGRTGGK